MDWLSRLDFVALYEPCRELFQERAGRHAGVVISSDGIGWCGGVVAWAEPAREPSFSATGGPKNGSDWQNVQGLGQAFPGMLGKFRFPGLRWRLSSVFSEREILFLSVASWCFRGGMRCDAGLS